SPEMGIGLCVNQLHIDPHLIGRFLHATFKNVLYAKLLGDLTKILGLALILLCGSARNYFQTRDASQPRQDLLVDTVCKIGAIRIVAEIFKWKHCDSVCYPDLVG